MTMNGGKYTQMYHIMLIALVSFYVVSLSVLIADNFTIPLINLDHIKFKGTQTASSTSPCS